LLYIYPALVTALSAFFLKEHLTTVKVVALFFALSGTALTIQITSGGSIIGILLAIALISTVISFVTFFAGLKRIGPTTASTLSTFEPIVPHITFHDGTWLWDERR
jgi:drug/metabolite transporter (DMT)-like permease